MRMSADRAVDSGWWDAAFGRQGHTGWADSLVYAYDQPIRIASVRRALGRIAPSGLHERGAVDVGCGTGDFTLLLRRAGARVLAFDFSAAVLEKLRARLPADASDVRIVQASATDIPAESGSADVITSITVLQHLVHDDDLARALREFRRVLRPEGRIIILELAPPIPAPNLSPDGHVIERPTSAWRQAIESAGLRIEREATYPQWGITLLRLLARAIDGARGTAPAAPPAVASAAVAERPGPMRQLLRVGLTVARAGLLGVAWPLDHLFRLPVPAAHRYYRLWQVKKNQGDFE